MREVFQGLRRCNIQRQTLKRNNRKLRIFMKCSCLGRSHIQQGADGNPWFKIHCKPWLLICRSYILWRRYNNRKLWIQGQLIRNRWRFAWGNLHHAMSYVDWFLIAEWWWRNSRYQNNWYPLFSICMDDIDINGRFWIWPWFLNCHII